MSFDGLQPLRLATAPERIADQIRASIIDGSLAPGTQLTEAQLAERLLVSRGPVREAMQRLIQEGLLRAERHRGVFVTELELEDAADIYLARGAVERSAASLLVHHGSNAALDALRAVVTDLERAVESGSWRDVVEADLRFHEALVSGSGSRRLMRMFRTLVAETRMLIAATMPSTSGNWQSIVHDHRALLDALERRDETAMLALLNAHLSGALRRTGAAAEAAGA